jgi:zinc-ribbon family
VIILFGTRTYLYQLAVLTLVCGRCGNPAAHALRKRIMKFTLFFVPLFPISTKYTTQCAFCGAEQQVPKEQAEGLLATPAQDGSGNAPGGGAGQVGFGQQGHRQQS